MKDIIIGLPTNIQTIIIFLIIFIVTFLIILFIRAGVNFKKGKNGIELFFSNKKNYSEKLRKFEDLIIKAVTLSIKESIQIQMKFVNGQLKVLMSEMHDEYKDVLQSKKLPKEDTGDLASSQSYKSGKHILVIDIVDHQLHIHP